MSIYRGSGGSGDASSDVSINEVTILSQAASTSAIEAASSATSATSSATSATTSASNASASESAASTSATNAASSATASANSATAAATSETNASTSETNAAASAAAAVTTLSTSALKANNLSDLANASTARTNLGLVIGTDVNNYVHPNHSGEVTSTADGATVIASNIVDEDNLKVSNSPTNGQYLQAQSGAGGGLTWAAVDALPDQTGNTGEYLTTDGSAASWAALDTDANTTTKGLYEHAHTISTNYTIASGNNALSSGVMTVDAGVTVTVPSNSTWSIV